MNLKNYFVSAIFAGLVGCAAHNPAPVAVAPPPPAPAVVAVAPAPTAPVVAPAAPAAPVDPLLVSGDGWSLKMPDASWESVDKDNLPSEEILALVQNSELSARGMLFGSPFRGPSAIFPLVVLKSVTENGGKIVGKPNTITINGNEFIHAVTTNGKLHIQVWAVAKNGNGYVLMCGSQTTNPKVAAACNQIASSLNID